MAAGASTDGPTEAGQCDAGPSRGEQPGAPVVDGGVGGQTVSGQSFEFTTEPATEVAQQGQEDVEEGEAFCSSDSAHKDAVCRIFADDRTRHDATSSTSHTMNVRFEH